MAMLALFHLRNESVIDGGDAASRGGSGRIEPELPKQACTREGQRPTGGAATNPSGRTRDNNQPTRCAESGPSMRGTMRGMERTQARTEAASCSARSCATSGAGIPDPDDGHALSCERGGRVVLAAVEHIAPERAPSRGARERPGGDSGRWRLPRRARKSSSGPSSVTSSSPSSPSVMPVTRATGPDGRGEGADQVFEVVRELDAAGEEGRSHPGTRGRARATACDRVCRWRRS